MGKEIINTSTTHLENIFNELKITQKSLDEDMIILKEWYDKQPHFPAYPEKLDDEIKLWIQSLLIATKNSIERVKESIEAYIFLRTDHPQIFDDKLVRATYQNEFYKAVTVITLPNLTKDQRIIFYWCFNNENAANFDSIYLIQRFRVVLDYHIKKGTRFLGYHSIMNVSNLGLNHLTQVDLMFLRKVMSFATKAYPLRVTNVHIVNPPTFIEYAYNVIKPFISKKIMSRVLIHKNISSLSKTISPDVLPIELGGSMGSIQEIKDEWDSRVIETNRLLDVDDFVLNKSVMRAVHLARYQDSDINITNEFGESGTFRKLCVD